MTIRSTPDCAAFAIWWARNGTPAVGSNGFGVPIVSGRSLVPCPPTSRIASSMPVLPCVSDASVAELY